MLQLTVRIPMSLTQLKRFKTEQDIFVKISIILCLKGK